MDSTPDEVASAIIHEAQRRGYSPAQTIAILADGLQESGLHPRAVSPNRLWENIFQQHSSYPGRGDPNTAISEFFNRLQTHGGPTSPDIWKSIFWLQQRPGEASADAAFAHGRQAYMSEIQNQVARATQLYRSVTGLRGGGPPPSLARLRCRANDPPRRGRRTGHPSRRCVQRIDSSLTAS